MEEPAQSDLPDVSLSSEPEPPVVVTQRADPVDRSIFFFLFVIGLSMLALGITAGLVMARGWGKGNIAVVEEPNLKESVIEKTNTDGLLRPGPILNPSILPVYAKPTPTPGVLFSPVCGVYFRKNQSAEFSQGTSTSLSTVVRSLQNCYEWINDSLLKKQHCGQPQAIEVIGVLTERSRFVDVLPENLNRDTEFVLRQICLQ